MATDPAACPECSGPSQPGHPLGLLAGWHHGLDCSLLAAEDRRTIADTDQLDFRRSFDRPATSAEQVLLAALGYTWPAAEPPATHVDGHLRARTWPTATPPEEAP